jgi:hypothetical protein
MIFIETIDSLLNSAKALPTLCVEASAQKASRAKVQKCFKIKGFFKVCTAEIELATARPKIMQALGPSTPPTIPAAFQDATSLEFKAPILNLYTIIVKSG